MPRSARPPPPTRSGLVHRPLLVVPQRRLLAAAVASGPARSSFGRRRRTRSRRPSRSFEAVWPVGGARSSWCPRRLRFRRPRRRSSTRSGSVWGCWSGETGELDIGDGWRSWQGDTTSSWERGRACSRPVSDLGVIVVSRESHPGSSGGPRAVLPRERCRAATGPARGRGLRALGAVSVVGNERARPSGCRAVDAAVATRRGRASRTGGARPSAPSSAPGNPPRIPLLARSPATGSRRSAARAAGRQRARRVGASCDRRRASCGASCARRRGGARIAVRRTSGSGAAEPNAWRSGPRRWRRYRSAGSRRRAGHDCRDPGRSWWEDPNRCAISGRAISSWWPSSTPTVRSGARDRRPRASACDVDGGGRLGPAGGEGHRAGGSAERPGDPGAGARQPGSVPCGRGRASESGGVPGRIRRVPRGGQRCARVRARCHPAHDDAGIVGRRPDGMLARARPGSRERARSLASASWLHATSWRGSRRNRISRRRTVDPT